MARATTKATVKKARTLRRTMTLPEVMLWQFLRGKPEGLRFRRQHPIGPYVLDFYCPAASIAIEVDGIAHDMGDNPVRDQARDAWLERQGITVLRIAAAEILADALITADAVVRRSQAAIDADLVPKPAGLPSPLHRFAVPLPMNGEDSVVLPIADGEVAVRSTDGGANRPCPNPQFPPNSPPMTHAFFHGTVHTAADDMRAALTADPAILALWQSLTPLGRNEFICWVEDAKQAKTRERRITRTIEELMEGKRRPCCWAGCIHRDDKPPSKWQQDVLIDKKGR